MTTERKSILINNLTGALAALFLWAAVPMPAAQAGVVGTDAAVQTIEHEQARDKVETFLARDDVRDKLISQGIDPVEAQQRVDSLTPAETRQLAGRIDELPAGGADIVGALVFIFVLLLVTDLLGLTNVFPWTR